jgi:hypothetical protein
LPTTLPRLRRLGILPVRPRQIFIARFATVLLFSTALVVVMNLLPSIVAPLEFGGRWQKNPSLAVNIGAQAVSSGLGCFFVLFAIVALQGVLLNLLPVRLFARVSVYVQAGLIGAALEKTGGGAHVLGSPGPGNGAT